MSKQRHKIIMAGRLVREVLWTPSFPCDSPVQRAGKLRQTTAARQAINYRYAWQKLKMTMAANFSEDDLFVSLTYDDEHLPRSRGQAQSCVKRFLVQLRAERRAAGRELLYVYNIESRHGDGRWHHHLLLNAVGGDYDQVRGLWVCGKDVSFEPVGCWGYTELAKYFCKEAPGVGARNYVPSLNLQKPYSPPSEWVPGSMRLEVPVNAHVVLSERLDNEYGRYQYLEYILPEPSRVCHARTGA